VKILSGQSYQRQLPSPGLHTESMSYVLKKLGFGSVVYTVDKDSDNPYKIDEFKDLMFIYIESGIPIIATLSNDINYHAVLVIGRENVDKEIEIKRDIKGYISNGKIYGISKAFQKVLIMNDNTIPYQLNDFSKPSQVNGTSKPYSFRSFIVPLYSKVHLDAFQFRKYFFLVIDVLASHEETMHVVFFNKNQENIFRFFLTSSRSYKQYIVASKEVNSDFKVLTINTSMPKFIWVGEIIHGKVLNKTQVVQSVIVIDATESGISGHLIFASNSKYLVFNNTFTRPNEIDHKLSSEHSVPSEGLAEGKKTVKKYKIFNFDQNTVEQKIKLFTFANNLKGEHTQWGS
jgi:hypothetical protein